MKYLATEAGCEWDDDNAQGLYDSCRLILKEKYSICFVDDTTQMKWFQNHYSSQQKRLQSEDWVDNGHGGAKEITKATVRFKALYDEAFRSKVKAVRKIIEFMEDSTIQKQPFVQVDLNNWIVLLTTCVTRNNSSTTRQYNKMYTDRILDWISNSSLPIVIVENSGVGFPHLHEYVSTNRIDIVINNSTQRSYEEGVSVSELEAESLNAAIEYMNNHPQGKFDNRTHVLKVTGRYFLANVEEALKEMNGNNDFYLQRHRYIHLSGFQHSEYFGIRKELIHNLTALVFQWKIFMEQALWRVSHRYSFELFHHGFPNDVPSGDGLVFDPL